MDKIPGFTFSGFRSFPSDDFAVLDNLAQINLIAGQNNSGKSNVLRVILDTYRLQAPEGYDARGDRPLGEAEHQYRRFLLVDSSTAVESVRAKHQLRRSAVEQLGDLLNTLAASRPTQDGVDQQLWIGVQERGQVVKGWESLYQDALDSVPLESNLVRTLGITGASTRAQYGAAIMRIVSDALPPSTPQAFLVEGTRSISVGVDEEPDLNGRGIKARLQKLQHPALPQWSDREQFSQIQSFVRAVLEDPDVTIDMPHDLSTILVTQRGHTLPIEYLGAGIHEVVILAAAATVVQESILCIEEPEVHLHPILQRKLLRYLSDSTTNQYFIATHSAHMLDSSIGKIFHVTLDGRWSRIRSVGSAQDRSAVCADLGYRPSDIVQTNAVLWVEGPSDRIYLRHWIDKLRPNAFIEGVHYSIMFYGGSLLSELSPLDFEEVDEFISLRRLNRHMVVMIDSDRTGARSALNASKQRVVDDLARDPSTGLAWVTKGYTVENYVPHHILADAVRSAHTRSARKDIAGATLFQNPLDPTLTGVSQPSKVAIAKQAVAQWGDNWPLDLRERVEDVVSLIERANGTK